MKNSKFVIDKIAKLFEQGLVSSKDLADEIMTILKSKGLTYYDILLNEKDKRFKEHIIKAGK